MISFDFEYYQPSSMNDALTTYNRLRDKNKQAMYYSGGTEFISRARRDEIQVDAIIDVKGIPECASLEVDQENLVIGSATPLTQIVDSAAFPLLSDVAKTIATHTEQNKITIGGNMMSHLPYKEILMPLLVANSRIHCFGDHGSREISIHDFTSANHSLADNEFITHIQTPVEMTKKHFFSVKKTKQSAINYPIVSLAAIVDEDQMQVACSGLCDFPFRNESLEAILNNSSLSIEERISKCVDAIPAPIVDDIQALQEYRLFIFQQALSDMFSTIEGVTH